MTSPFALISSAFGGSGGDELGYAEFAPGSATLAAATQTKLDTIAKTLKNRPALKLDLIGRVDPVTDTDGVRQQILNRKLAALKLKDSLNQSDDAQSDDVTLTEADKQKYMGRVYSAEKFDKPPQRHRLCQVPAGARNGKTDCRQYARRVTCVLATRRAETDCRWCR